jgi:hypothetical protein
MAITNRCELIQSAVDTIKAHSYLEIGVADKSTFNAIQCLSKASVDPNVDGVSFKLTSDDFFKQNHTMFDVIFIDGLHEKEQVLRDMNNSIACLNPKGIIITHDTLPLDSCQTNGGLCWNAWEAFAQLRRTTPNVFMASVILSNDSVGSGVIRHGSQTLYEGPMPNGWAEYTEHRNELMNVISLEKLMTTWQ